VFGLKIDRSKKYLIVAGVFLLLAGTLYRVWPAIQTLGVANDDILLKEKQISKYQRALRARGELEAQVQLLEKSLKQRESQLFTGDTPAIAAADIQKVLQEIAQKSQVEIKTVRVLKPDTAAKSRYLNIPVQLNIDGTIRNLKEFFYRIMISPKCLTVRKVGLRVLRRRKGQMDTIRADITVNGYLKKADG
jgi:Tfp pilus assembly protein PilO